MADAVASGLAAVRTEYVVIVWGDQVALKRASLEFCMRLIEGPAAMRGGWMEVGAGAFLIVACISVLLWPILGAETNLFLRLPSEMEACKATA